MIALQPIAAGDVAFLLDVYASTRADELALLPWTDAQKHDFIRMQFDAQHHAYRSHFPEAAFDLILVDGARAGRLYVDRPPHEVRIVDIALLPAYRGRGIGTTLITGLQQEAAAGDRPLRIHVERFNPALRLYERLGFTPLDDRGVYLQLEWRGGPA